MKLRWPLMWKKTHERELRKEIDRLSASHRLRIEELSADLDLAVHDTDRIFKRLAKVTLSTKPEPVCHSQRFVAEVVLGVDQLHHMIHPAELEHVVLDRLCIYLERCIHQIGIGGAKRLYEEPVTGSQLIYREKDRP